MDTRFGTREEWLEAAVLALTPLYGVDLSTVRVSCGWPLRGGASLRRRTIGACHLALTTPDKRPHLFISPVLAEPIEVLETLAHELCHAVVDVPGHKGPFVSLARKIGLEGKPTATHAGPALAERLNSVLDRLGAYPHVGLIPTTRTKPGSRLRLFTCLCGIKVRVAHDEFAATCDECGEAFARVEK